MSFRGVQQCRLFFFEGEEEQAKATPGSAGLRVLRRDFGLRELAFLRLLGGLAADNGTTGTDPCV